jgi:phage tape measure protein
MAQYKQSFNSDLEKKRAAETEAARQSQIKATNEFLQLKDREFNLAKRQTELISDETARRIRLVEIEHSHTAEQYTAMLKKGEITKDYYARAMALEEQLYQKQMFDASSWGQVMQNGLSGLESAMGNFLDYSSDKFMKFGDLAQDVLGQIYKALVKEFIISQMIAAIRQGIMGMFGGSAPTLSSKFASVGPGMSGGGAVGISQFAQGGVFSSPDLHSYANSIVSKPTFFKFAKGGIPDIGVMGEKNGGSPEAIMPLTRTSNGDLGVKAQIATSLNNVKIEIINQSKEDIKVANTSVRQDLGEQVISIVIDGINRNKQGLRDMIGGSR